MKIYRKVLLLALSTGSAKASLDCVVNASASLKHAVQGRSVTQVWGGHDMKKRTFLNTINLGGIQKVKMRTFSY